MIQRVLSALLAVVFTLAAIVFTSILIAITLTGGLLLAGWARWRSRKPVPERRGRVIEGEYREVPEQNYHLRP